MVVVAFSAITPSMNNLPLPLILRSSFFATPDCTVISPVPLILAFILSVTVADCTVIFPVPLIAISRFTVFIFPMTAKSPVPLR